MFGRNCNRYTRRQAKRSRNVPSLLISLISNSRTGVFKVVVIISVIVIVIISVMNLYRITNIFREIYGGCATDDGYSARSFVT